MDLSTTTAPKSDQQNYDDVAVTPRFVTISDVKQGSAEQPVAIELVEFPGRPYKPSKSMRRVLIAAWGKDTSVYPGRRMKLVGDASVKFAGETVGGIKIAALSDIDGPLSVSLTVTRGKRSPHKVEPLTEAASTTPKPTPIDALIAHYGTEFNVTRQQLEAHVALPVDEWTPETLDALKVLGGQLKRGEKSVADEFDATGVTAAEIVGGE